MNKVTRFRIGQRIRVTGHDSHAEMNGLVGTVVRLLHSTSEAAWINFDCDLPDGCHPFPAGDPGGRDRWAKIYLDECEELK